MNLFTASTENIEKAALLIRKGGVVAFPTETVYGLGADAFKPSAVARIFDIKKRPYFDPLIVHIADPSWLPQVCVSVSSKARILMEHFWPGPLTLVMSKNVQVPDLVTAGLSTVAVRMPNHPVALELIKKSGTPIAAPSANPFGFLSPTTALDVDDQLGSQVDLILDSGQCSVGVESTILDLSAQVPVLLRPGGIALEEIERVIGRVALMEDHKITVPLAPGQLPRHYSPRTPLKILSYDSREESEKKAGLLAFKTIPDTDFYFATEVLSPEGDLVQAAANLFSSLHRLDKAGVDVIYAEPVPEKGLGRAIMDRLRRASK